MVYRTTPFSMTLNDPKPDFKVTPFDAECHRDGTRCIVTMEYYNRDLHTLYSRVSFQMTLSDLAKYSITHVRPLRDSWACCLSIDKFFVCFMYLVFFKNQYDPTRAILSIINIGILCRSWPVTVVGLGLPIICVRLEVKLALRLVRPMICDVLQTKAFEWPYCLVAA